MRRSTLLLLVCALAGAFPAGLALATAVPRLAAGGGSSTNTSSDALPDDGPSPAPAAIAPVGPAVVGGRLRLPPALVGSVHVQWQACRGTRCAAIRGATGPGLVLTASLAGRTVRVVAVTDAGVRIVSKASAPVRAKR